MLIKEIERTKERKVTLFQIILKSRQMHKLASWLRPVNYCTRGEVLGGKYHIKRNLFSMT